MKINTKRTLGIIGTIGCVVGGAYALGDDITRLIDKVYEHTTCEQSVKQEEQDLPYQTVCQRYAKSGLAGILAIGRAKDLDPVSKEMYREQYEEMVALYDSLAREYQIDHPNYQSKTFLSSDVVFGG